jgi:Flp pilus assembly protein TadD
MLNTHERLHRGCLHAATTQNPSNHVYYSNRSACYASLGKQQEAADDASKCIELNPNFIKGYYR